MKTSGFRCETKFRLLVFLGHPIQESWPLPHPEVDGKWSNSSRKEVRSQGFISIVLVLKLKKSTFPSLYSSGNRQFNTPYLYTRPTSPGAAGDTDRSIPCHSSLSHSETWGESGFGKLTSCFDLMVLFNSTQCSIIVSAMIFFFTTVSWATQNHQHHWLQKSSSRYLKHFHKYHH